MGWTGYQIVLALTMVVTGSLNTLSTKWADSLESENKYGKQSRFHHPYVQACGMFIGEILCLITFKLLCCIHDMKKPTEGEGTNIELSTPSLIKGNQKFNPFIFLPPAVFDMIGTSVMYLGLNLTYASSFQMLRGAVIIFTAVLSIIFIKRKMEIYHWLGMFFIIAGLAIVGCTDMLGPQPPGGYSIDSIILGDSLIVCAQIMTAAQMVFEEKYVSKYNVAALQVVGWEGIFGFSVLALLCIPFYFIKVGPPISGNQDGTIEDAPDAFIQMGNNWQIILAIVGNSLSIAFFNFSGVSVTKEMSATTRMVLDSVRTIVIWVVSISLKWQEFLWLHLVGFIVLISGMFIYNNLLFYPLLKKCGVCKDKEPEVCDDTIEVLQAPPEGEEGATADAEGRSTASAKPSQAIAPA